MKLLIDAREPKELINLIKSDISDKITIEIANLDLGDFIIKDDSDNNNNNNVLLIFERKSLSDLMSSVKDCRYREQSFRLNEYPIHNHNIYYILEGDLNRFILKNTETNKKILTSSLVSLSHFKGFSVLRTMSIPETAELIVSFARKLLSENKPGFYKLDSNELKESTEPRENISLHNYSETLKTCKKSNVTRENIGEIMLSQIPNVSINGAKHIMKKFHSLNNLFKQLENDANCLNDIYIENKSGKRKLGKTSIENIKKFLSNSCDQMGSSVT